MVRGILAGVIGAVVVHLWGMAAWLFIPLHGPTISALPNESAMVEQLTTQSLKTGVYTAPFGNPDEFADPASEFQKKHRAGPIFSLFYHAEGAPPMELPMILRGFLIYLAGSFLAVIMLSATLAGRPNYGKRVLFVTGLGIFVALIAHASYWNWMFFPDDFTLAFIADVVIGWTLAGLAIAALVRPSASGPSVAGSRSGESSSHSVSGNQSKTPIRPKLGTDSPKPQPPARSEAVTLLATLQREARFLDMVKEPLANYSDAQIGAAARDVLRDCGLVLDRLFDLQPVVAQAEGEKLTLPKGYDAGLFRVTGNMTSPPIDGSVVHAGWKATHCRMPQWNGSADSALVVAPAEIEVK